MKQKDMFGDEIEKVESEDFASLFANSARQIDKKLSVGDHVQAEILSISREEAFVSTGSTQDGIIAVKELLDENKNLKYKVGDTVDAVVVRISHGEIRLAKKGSRQVSEDVDSLQDAFDMELPVEGFVQEVSKGGYRVKVLNKLAFCPFSQMELRQISAPESLVGKKLEFIITQFDTKGRNIVISRRKLLELGKAEDEGRFLQEHKPGDILSGKITRIEKYGAFVALDSGIEGLIPISELAWGRIKDPTEVVSLGQPVQVKILRIQEEDTRLKISFSLKEAGGEGNPWLRVPEVYPVGSLHAGVVDKKEVYGLFVQLAPGINGLLPRSKWRDSLEASQYEMKKKGDPIQVRIDQILFEEKKISLGLPEGAQDDSWKGFSNTGSSSGSGFGSLGDLFKKIK